MSVPDHGTGLLLFYLHLFYLHLLNHITKTCLYIFDPLKPHFYIAKLGFTGVYIIFLIFAQNIHCGYSLEPPHRGGSLEPPRRGGSNEYPQSMFWAEMWKISEFLSENFQFLEVKFSIYLNRRVFVMQALCEHWANSGIFWKIICGLLMKPYWLYWWTLLTLLMKPYWLYWWSLIDFTDEALLTLLMNLIDFTDEALLTLLMKPYWLYWWSLIGRKYCPFDSLWKDVFITKTRLFKCTENFPTKKWKFSDKNFLYFSYFCSKHRLWILIRTASTRRF